MDDRTSQSGVQNTQIDSSLPPVGSATMPLPQEAPPMVAPISTTPATKPPIHTVPSRVSGPAAEPAPAAVPVESPIQAADADTIEPIWIDRVKQVVADTRSDPFRQVQEIQKLKREYMKKRYDKDIKMDEA